MIDFQDFVDAERRWLFGTDPSDEVYDSIRDVFKEPDDFYNRPAPDAWVAFAIGGILSAITMIYWFFFRWLPLRKTLWADNSSNSLKVRGFITTLSDNDNPTFTILRLASQSMLFLGGFQLNYQYTFAIMLVYFAFVSFGDTVRVFLSLNEAENLQDLIVVSKRDKRFLSAQLKQDGKTQVVLKTANVYENVSRRFIIVMMVFITQFLLITFVVVDVIEKETHSALDGTGGVPVCGTLGGWLIYLLGIFMQTVYILGPKTSFGTSEQNPHYWLQLLLSSKKSGAKCKWYDPVEDKDMELDITPGNLMLWVRFFMSYTINGLGFHILVHALPVQVAGQSSLTGVVFRAVGMMYLVDLDDAPGTALTLIEGDRTAQGGKKGPKESGSTANTKPELSKPLKMSRMDITQDAEDSGVDKEDAEAGKNNGNVVGTNENGVAIVGTTETATKIGLTAQELIDNAKTRAKEIERELVASLNALAEQNGLQTDEAQ